MTTRYLKITIVLLAVMVIGGATGLTACTESRLIEIQPPDTASQEDITQAYIGGAVTIPGIYPLKAGDTLESLIQAAGGLTSGADLERLKLYIPQVGEDGSPQRIDINRAETWLLEALPGIGPVKAQAIIDYRRQNGPFSSTNELIRVEGIGTATYEKFKDLITVTD